MSPVSEPTASAPGGPAHHTLTLDSGVVLHYFEWVPTTPTTDGAVSRVINIAHGVGEHALRYRHLAEALARAGYRVFASDHLGHGQTAHSIGAALGDLGPGHTKAAISAMRQFGEHLRAQHPDAFITLIAHSWGSLMGQKIIQTSDTYDAVVLSGTSLAVPGILGIGNFNKRWKSDTATGYEWLSRDPAVWKEFDDDPLCFSLSVTPAWSTLEALAFLGRPARRMPRDIPILIQAGSDDPLGGVRGSTLLQKAYLKRSRLSDVTLMLYEGARHEIYNEINRDEVIGDLLAWLEARRSGSQSSRQPEPEPQPRTQSQPQPHTQKGTR